MYFFSSPNLYSSNSQDTLLLDPKIRHGKLPNGLTYYIKPINDSSSKIDIRLFVKAGSSVLDPDQYEIEHFLEHIAFKAGNNMNIGKANDPWFQVRRDKRWYIF